MRRNFFFYVLDLDDIIALGAKSIDFVSKHKSVLNHTLSSLPMML